MRQTHLMTKYIKQSSCISSWVGVYLLCKAALLPQQASVLTTFDLWRITPAASTDSALVLQISSLSIVLSYHEKRQRYFASALYPTEDWYSYHISRELQHR